jgi:hypothetical protein
MLARLDNPKELREWAAEYALEAKRVTYDSGQHARLLRIHEALLDLAKQAEWLNGKSEAVTVEFNCGETGPISNP